METNSAATKARDDLRAVLHGAETPLSLGEISSRLALPYRFVASTLFQEVGRGSVERVAGGRYALCSGSLERTQRLDELFEFVHVCEAEWRLDDRLAALDRYGASTR